MSLFNSILVGGPKPVWIRYLLIIGLFTLIIRVILDSRIGQSAVLYVLVPYLVSVVLYVFVPQPKGRTRWVRFSRHLLAALIVMLSTSVLLFEGFICVLMFLPIYIFFSIITYALRPKVWPKEEPDIAKKFETPLLAIVIAIMSLEGTVLEFDRENTVVESKIVDLSVPDIRENLLQPIHLKGDRSWFLSLFPLPYKIQAGSLKEGDIHTAYFRYNRWGLRGFNSKTGKTRLRLSKVTPEHIQTQVVFDDSYFSHYITIHGTDVRLTPISENQTKVDLTIHYRRDLDPAWYFGPMQRGAIKESANYLIDHVIARTSHETD